MTNALQRLMDDGLFPYTRRYLGTLRNHFSTLGLNGVNEMIRNFTADAEDITTDWGEAFAIRLLDHVRGLETAVAGWLPGRLRQQALPLVIAHGVDGDTGAGGEFADLHWTLSGTGCREYPPLTLVQSQAFLRTRCGCPRRCGCR